MIRPHGREANRRLARRARQPNPAAPPPRRSPWLPILAAIVIAALILGLLIVILPGGGSAGNSHGSGDVLPPPTPGAAEAQMRARLQQNPDDLNAMQVLADILANSGRIDEAIPYYEKIVQQKPDDETIRVAFGTALLHASYNADAEQELLKAHDLSPNDPQPLYLLGQLYEAWQPPRIDDARSMYSAAITADPESAFAARAQDRLNALAQP